MHQPLVEIKKPWHEALDAKKPGEQGHYCKTCRITVVDFTGMKPEEISAYLMSHEVHCGSFNRKDISTGNKTDAFISRLQSGRLKFAAVLLVSFILLISCRVRRGKVVQGGIGWKDKSKSSIEHLK